MKQLLAIAVLLAASTAHAETYICTPYAKKLLLLNEQTGKWDVRGFDIKDSLIVKIESGMKVLHHNDSIAYQCPHVVTSVNGLFCNTTRGQFVLDTSVKKYISTSLNVQSSDSSIEYGKCKLFEQ